MIEKYFNNWTAALHKKERIASNKEAYYYYVKIATIHKQRYIKPFGAYKKKTKYHTEKRFNEQKFNADLAAADAEINFWTIKVNEVIAEKQSLLVLANQTYDNIGLLKTEISNLKSKTCAYYDNEAQIRSKIYQATSELNSLVANKNELDSAVSTANSNLIQTQTQTTELKKELSVINAQLTAEERLIGEHITNASEKQRAALVANLYNNQNAEKFIEIIEKLGFDQDYLGYLAIDANNEELYEVALDYGADYASYSVQSHNGDFITLLQKTILENKENLTVKILTTTEDLSITLVNAIKNTDAKTIATVVNYDKSYLHKQIHGYTLLHIAISAKNLAVVDQILNLDVSCATDQTIMRESTFKIALRAGNQEIIDKISIHINVDQEIQTLIEEHETELLEKVIHNSNTQVSYETAQELLSYAIENKLQGLAEILSSHNYNTFNDIQNNHDYALGAFDKHIEGELFGEYHQVTDLF